MSKTTQKTCRFYQDKDYSYLLCADKKNFKLPTGGGNIGQLNNCKFKETKNGNAKTWDCLSFGPTKVTEPPDIKRPDFQVTATTATKPPDINPSDFQITGPVFSYTKPQN